MKKRTKKLLFPGAAGPALGPSNRHGRASGGAARGHPRLKAISAIVFLAFTTPAFAQTTPNAANNCGIITLPQHPGDAPGGNVFTPAVSGPQPADLPDDQTATYPDITPITPDPINPSQITPDQPGNQPFPFSHVIADPVLAHGFGPETAAPPPKKPADKQPTEETMAKLVVLYKTPTDTAAFDKHYNETHIPLAKKIPGILSYTLSDGIVASPAGESGVHLVAILEFESLAAIAAAFGTPEGQAAGADVATFATGGADLLMFDTKEV